MPTMKRVALYLRVSTDKKTSENQRRELAAVAEQRGWAFDQPDRAARLA